MTKVNPIIVGIDPGTTTAYAVLDDFGNIISKKSSKELDLSKVISEIIKFGNPVIIGCDKNPAPKFVQKIATKVGAKLVYPDQDLTQDEKKSMVNIKTKNDHEMDALASAVFAFNDYRELFMKVEKVLKKEKKEHLMNDVKYFVVKADMSIRQAINQLERQEEPEIQMPNVKIQTVRPEKEIKELEKRIAMIEEKSNKVYAKLKATQKENQKLKSRIKGMPVSEVVKQKESNVKSMAGRLKKEEEKTKAKEKEIKTLKKLIANSTGKIIAKKLKNLSKKEIKNMQINKNEVLLVEDANIASKEVLESLRDWVTLIIFRKKLVINYKGFNLINADELDLEETEDFALVKKEQLRRSLASKDVFTRVVVEYKKDREA